MMNEGLSNGPPDSVIRGPQRHCDGRPQRRGSLDGTFPGLADEGEYCTESPLADALGQGKALSADEPSVPRGDGRWDVGQAPN